MALVNVQVRFYSILKQYAREHGIGDVLTLSVEEGTTISQIVERAGIPIRRVGRYMKNGQILQPDYAPAEGDVIDVIPPTISGG
jgi:molybdopterin converting factor small subunit